MTGTPIVKVIIDMHVLIAIFVIALDMFCWSFLFPSLVLLWFDDYL